MNLAYMYFGIRGRWAMPTIAAQPASYLLAGPELCYLGRVHIVKVAVWTHSCWLWSFKDSC